MHREIINFAAKLIVTRSPVASKMGVISHRTPSLKGLRGILGDSEAKLEINF